MRTMEQVVKITLWLRLMVTIIAGYAIYCLVKILNDKRATTEDIVAFSIAAFVAIVITIVFNFMKVYFTEDGVRAILGIENVFVLRSVVRKWKDIEIRYYPFLLIPAVALDKNRLPIIWCHILSNFSGAMRVLAEYGMNRALEDVDRTYLRRYLKT